MAASFIPTFAGDDPLERLKNRSPRKRWHQLQSNYNQWEAIETDEDSEHGDEWSSVPPRIKRKIERRNSRISQPIKQAPPVPLDPRQPGTYLNNKPDEWGPANHKFQKRYTPQNNSQDNSQGNNIIPPSPSYGASNTNSSSTSATTRFVPRKNQKIVDDSGWIKASKPDTHITSTSTQDQWVPIPKRNRFELIEPTKPQKKAVLHSTDNTNSIALPTPVTPNIKTPQHNTIETVTNEKIVIEESPVNNSLLNNTATDSEASTTLFGTPLPRDAKLNQSKIELSSPTENTSLKASHTLTDTDNTTGGKKEGTETIEPETVTVAPDSLNIEIPAPQKITVAENPGAPLNPIDDDTDLENLFDKKVVFPKTNNNEPNLNFSSVSKPQKLFLNAYPPPPPNPFLIETETKTQNVENKVSSTLVTQKETAMDDLDKPKPIHEIFPFRDYQPADSIDATNPKVSLLCEHPDSTEVCPPVIGLGDSIYQERQFAHFEYQWYASNITYNPLYFEDVTLERYGHTHHELVQPFVSVGRFGVQLFGLPYQWVIHPPHEEVSPLGYYRPGEPAPRLLYQVPLNPEAAAVTAGFYTGMFFLIP